MVEGKQLVKNTDCYDRMLTNGKSEAFITLKDHKPNFQNNPKVRLINPAKNELGRISKAILDKINKKLNASLQVNQWKDTKEVLQWFNDIPEKGKHKFIIFDIKDFYPSISMKLLNDAIKFAMQHTEISNEDICTIEHARKSLLFHSNQSWMKKESDLFDVTMGAYDGAEVCELVGIYLQYLISLHYNKQYIGLYRDDGLAVFKNVSGPDSERIKKKLQNIFKDHGLEIVIECNKTVVDYLDVTLNLNDGTYRPYHKPDCKIQYINTESNHPPNIIRQIPKTIEKRLSEHSSNETIFNDAKPMYEKALKESGYDVELKYIHPQEEQPKKRNRKRKVIWFNPPFNKNVSTPIANRFLNLVDKSFPKGHKYHKLFNRNNIKVSYSCSTSVKSLIDSHNKKVIKDNDNQEKRSCNCINKSECPVNGECLTENTVYEASITTIDSNSEKLVYIGSAGTTFKKRFANHKKSFNCEKYENDTELSKAFWKMKRSYKNPKINWKILHKCKPVNRSSMRCNLCISEKLEIALRRENIINSRSELVSKCRHVNQFSLMRYDSKD